MSVEEDNELRDLVSQTLETKGVLTKIRVSVFEINNTIYVPEIKVMVVTVNFLFLMTSCNVYLHCEQCSSDIVFEYQ